MAWVWFEVVEIAKVSRTNREVGQEESLRRLFFLQGLHVKSYKNIEIS